MKPTEAAVIRDGRPGDREPARALLADEGLASAYVSEEFLVAEAGGEVVGCARLVSLSEDLHELASVAVRPDRRGEGIGTRLVDRALARARRPVQALCLEPDFFRRFGFQSVGGVHPGLEAKAEACCADREFVAMAWRPSQ